MGTKFVIAGVTVIFVATLALAVVVAIMLVSHLKNRRDDDING